MEKIEYAFLLNTKEEVDDWGSTRSNRHNITLDIVRLEDRKIRNAPIDDPYEFLQIEATQSNRFLESGPGETYKTYGWNIHYRFTYAITVNLDRAKRMQRILSNIEKYMERERNKRGYAHDFGEYIVRIAKTLGIKLIIKETKHVGSRYDDNTYRIYSLGDGVDHIRNLFYKWGSKQLEGVKSES